jgi:hypothetical protein
VSEEELDERWEILKRWVDAHQDPEITEGDWYRQYLAEALAGHFYPLYNHYQDDK